MSNLSIRSRLLFAAGMVIAGQFIALMGFFSYIGESHFASDNYCGTPEAYSGCTSVISASTFAYGLAAVGVLIIVFGFVFFIRSGRRRQA
jgi:hypothetical protein